MGRNLLATRRAIRGALGNFLGTYTSRYSHYEGYWLFGFIVCNLSELKLDLLESVTTDSRSSLSVAKHTAQLEFKEQISQSGLEPSRVAEAWLTIRKLPDPVGGFVNGIQCTGNEIVFLAVAVMDNGRRYEKERVLFVAEHNPWREARSGRVK